MRSGEWLKQDFRASGSGLLQATSDVTALVDHIPGCSGVTAQSSRRSEDDCRGIAGIVHVLGEAAAAADGRRQVVAEGRTGRVVLGITNQGGTRPKTEHAPRRRTRTSLPASLLVSMHVYNSPERVSAKAAQLCIRMNPS
jgi:hypothetical protein